MILMYSFYLFVSVYGILDSQNLDALFQGLLYGKSHNCSNIKIAEAWDFQFFSQILNGTFTHNKVPGFSAFFFIRNNLSL